MLQCRFVNFYPRPPCGGRHSAAGMCQCRRRNFYPRPPCGGRPANKAGAEAFKNFYPRPPCGGRPLKPADPIEWSITFLSTSPLRGTTIYPRTPRPALSDFYPRPPCGGRRACVRYLVDVSAHFYPRPPCGGRRSWKFEYGHPCLFLSTSPLRGTTLSITDAEAVALTFLSTSPLRGTTGVL